MVTINPGLRQALSAVGILGDGENVFGCINSPGLAGLHGSGSQIMGRQAWKLDTLFQVTRWSMAHLDSPGRDG
jgi:hypothetical protein